MAIHCLENDPQKPHSKDEFYFICEGAGEFKMNQETISFKKCDVTFVPKNTNHKFKNFGAEMKTWVLFIVNKVGKE